MKKAIPVGGVTVLKFITALFKAAPSQGANSSNPTPDLVLEMLGSSQQWNMAVDMADAYGGACIAACEYRPGLWDPKWSY